ncbi:beta-lactamase family protein [Aerococcaceae bacterium INB8]|uniref:Beta-lactamase family protein n=1 Tax=Ruoffia halotolerans TaxID=2748684 RepID=A0A839A7Y4_9LACT|nr:serine hydrolase domain-containing protein [Ruoffia halotolerans]MBA5729828.1 beta-lactamase family protein [Ruoffia halotolerans]
MKLHRRFIKWGLATIVLLSEFITVPSISQDLPSFDSVFEEAINVSDDAIITIGYIEKGQTDFQVYTKEGVDESKPIHDYEVGSITKTFTGTLVSRAVEDGLLNIDESIGFYLNLPEDADYPTIRQLLTHTSGYPTFIENEVIIDNLTQGANPYQGVGREIMMNEIAENSHKEGKQPYQYSNFNAGVLGLVLESIYGESYAVLLENYIKEDLQLGTTHLFEEETPLGNNWLWSKETDAYVPAGALISNIEDMLSYLKLQLSEANTEIRTSHDVLSEVNATSSDNGELGIRIDAVAYQWMLNQKEDIIWHDGGTGGYTSYIGFNKAEEVGVVVLSNVAMDQGIPANLLGSLLLMEKLEKS